METIALSVFLVALSERFEKAHGSNVQFTPAEAKAYAHDCRDYAMLALNREATEEEDCGHLKAATA